MRQLPQMNDIEDIHIEILICNTLLQVETENQFQGKIGFFGMNNASNNNTFLQ